MGYEIIKEIAKSKGVSLETIAENAHITYNSLSKIIRNTVKEPKYSTMQSIAATLDMSIDELASMTGISEKIASQEKQASLLSIFSSDTLEVARAYDALPDVTERNYIRRALRLPELDAEASYELTFNNKKHA